MLRLVNPVRCIRPAVLALLTGLSMSPGAALAQDVEYRPWSELVVVVGHHVALPLPDGYVEGRAVAVTNDAIEVDVVRTSNVGPYQKGLTTIPRQRVSVIRLRRSDNRAPRVASQIIGQAAVMGGIFGLASRSGVRGNLRGAGVQIGAATAGAVLGRRIDNRQVETVIRVAPEPVNVASAPPYRRQSCGAEQEDSKHGINTLNVRSAEERSRNNVDEHDGGDRRAPGTAVPGCGDR